MRSWLPAVAVGLIVAVAALAVVLVVRPGAGASEAQRADALAAELRCPDCQGLSVADAPTTSAREIRRQIDELVAGGATDEEVRAHFVARYGEWIRLAPSAAAAWIIPFAVLVAGGAALAAWTLSRRHDPVPGAAVTDAQRRAVRDEAEALDA